MRSEQEIFDELAALCISPGYVHTIAYLAYRDTIIKYADTVTAEDMQEMFSTDRLLRTELSTLIGLLVKAEIDYSLPSADVTQRYITRTEELLEELHRAMSEIVTKPLREIVTSFLREETAAGCPDLFANGAALREPIFYSGESAYSFQYEELAARKYVADEAWLRSNKGFSIRAARDVIEALGRVQTQKLNAVMKSLRGSPPDQWTLLPGFTFTIAELSQAASIDESVVAQVLDAFALRNGVRNQGFKAIDDFNVANATPVLRNKDEGFILFQRYSLAEALYESPFYWMVGDKGYQATAMAHRGQFTEAFSRERLELVFGKDNVHCNVDVCDSRGGKIGEIDVLVIFGNRAIVLQAKSKRLTLEARKGNDNVIKDDFRKGVQDSYDQGYECAKQLGKQNVRLVDPAGREIEIPQKLRTVYILCVVSDHYPALSFQAQQFLKYEQTKTIRAPFVMDIFTLDVLTEMLSSPLYFLSYVDRRTGYSDKLMASHELVVLAYHLKKNLWFEEKFDTVLLEDDFAAELDVAMSARRDNLPGKRTPEGILTRIANSAVGNVLRQIEATADPATIELGFMLLTLSEAAVVKISEAMETIARKARHDRENHDFSVPLPDAASGLTIHCNDQPLSHARPRLEGHCVLRKYAEKARQWHGFCIDPRDMTLRFGISMRYEWKPNPEMDDAASRLRKPNQPRRIGSRDGRSKIGRNSPCPCGSGLKFKKCCLK